MDLRGLIIEQSRTGGIVGRGVWVLHVYIHLLDHGATPVDAMAAMTSFVNEIIAMKSKSNEQPSMGD